MIRVGNDDKERLPPFEITRHHPQSRAARGSEGGERLMCDLEFLVRRHDEHANR
ncbi:MAG: hypothetical protein RLZZ587_1025 [Actinomycetota bacterium]